MRLVRALALLLLLAPAACGGEPEDPLARARAEAKKIAPDAALVEMSFSGFGFATGSGGLPDMTRPGLPQMALFNFYSRASGKGFRITADINRPPMPSEMAKAMEDRGYKDLRVEQQGEVPFTPFTLPLPDTIGDLNRAGAAATAAIGAECDGGDPQISTCRLPQEAELHMHWTGPKDAGTPVWTVSFGQNPTTYETVRRTIADGSYGAYTSGDAQSADLNAPPRAPLKEADVKVEPYFDAVWPAVIAAVQKQDPAYVPYAVSLVTYLSDVRQAGGKAMLAEAHIQFARVTPSLIWDEMEAHVGWREGAEDDAELFFSQPKRHMAPAEPMPVALNAGDLPAAEPALDALLAKFPDKYTEVITTWSKGCEDVLTFVVGLRMWRCGVDIQNQEHTDLVFLWLSRQGNPYWSSGRAPLATEYDQVAAGTPKDGWAWWTRVKHPAYWEYFLIDAANGRPDTGFCTNPNDGTNRIALRACGP